MGLDASLLGTVPVVIIGPVIQEAHRNDRVRSRMSSRRRDDRARHVLVAREVARCDWRQRQGHDPADTRKLLGWRICRLSHSRSCWCALNSRLIRVSGCRPSPAACSWALTPRETRRRVFVPAVPLPAVFAAGIFELIKARQRVAGDTRRARPHPSLRRYGLVSSWATPQLPSCWLT